MKKWIIAAAACMFAANFALAAKPSCRAVAVDPNIPQELKRRILMGCAADEAGRACLKQADEKKLHGDARSSFLKKCVHEAHADDSR